MATKAIVVLQTLASKNSQDEPGSAAAVAEVKKQDGFVRAFVGQKLEDPDTSVFCTHWKSREAAQTYCASDSGLAVVAGEAKNETAVFELLPAAGQLSLRGVDGVFEAPCTEVFTAFGAEEGFIDNVSRFVDGLEKVGTVPIEGYLGAVFGEDVGTEGKEVGEKVVRMLIGWTSKEAHVEAKGKPGPIQDNIHELRTLRKAVDMFHVAFKEL